MSSSQTSEGFIFDTNGIDDALDLDEPEMEEQNMDEEAQRMMQSWDRSVLLNEIDEQKENMNKEEDDYTLYYDGTTSFEELKEGMESASLNKNNQVWVKKIDCRDSGKEIKATHTILFDRFGFFEYNPIPFESSIHDGKPTVLNLSVGPIIPGLVLGLLKLHQGERAQILVHPAMAYGPRGCPPIIPPNSYILFVVKIHKVWEEGDFDGMLEYEKSLNIMVPLQDKIDLAKQHKDTANQYLQDDQPREALIRYKAALKWLNDTPIEDKARSTELKELMNILYQNLAITFNKMGMHKSATRAAKRAIDINPRNVKAYYQHAKARIALGDYVSALRRLDQAKNIAPDNQSVNHLRAQIDVRLREEKEKRTEIMRKMSKACV